MLMLTNKGQERVDDGRMRPSITNSTGWPIDASIKGKVVAASRLGEERKMERAMGIEPTRQIKKLYKNLLVTLEMDRHCDWRATNRLFENGRLCKQLATLILHRMLCNI
jgi:hypothetical protein